MLRFPCSTARHYFARYASTKSKQPAIWPLMVFGGRTWARLQFKVGSWSCSSRTVPTVTLWRMRSGLKGSARLLMRVQRRPRLRRRAPSRTMTSQHCRRRLRVDRISPRRRLSTRPKRRLIIKPKRRITHLRQRTTIRGCSTIWPMTLLCISSRKRANDDQLKHCRIGWIDADPGELRARLIALSGRLTEIRLTVARISAFPPFPKLQHLWARFSLTAHAS